MHQEKLKRHQMKLQVTQDFLYEFLKEHDFNMSRLSEQMGVSLAIVTKCFHHDLNRHGKHLYFSVANIHRLNMALVELSEQILNSRINYGTDQMFTNRLSRTYDPGTVPGIKMLSKYFNLNNFLFRVLGWKKGKKESVLCSPSSKVYGFITSDDIMRINAELLTIASTFAGVQVVAESGFSAVDSSDNGIPTDN